MDPTWLVVSVGEKNVGMNKRYKHPRLSTIRHLLAFAGPKTKGKIVDVYDSATNEWKQTRIWGRLFVTAKHGSIVLSSDGTTIEKP